MWDKCEGGKVVWIERVREDGKTSEYVTKQIQVAKYVSKATIKASYVVDKRYRTLWRSQDTKAKFELTKDDEWCIIKEDVYRPNGTMSNYHAKKGVWNAKTKQQREDLEATRKPLSE